MGFCSYSALQKACDYAKKKNVSEFCNLTLISVRKSSHDQAHDIARHQTSSEKSNWCTYPWIWSRGAPHSKYCMYGTCCSLRKWPSAHSCCTSCQRNISGDAPKFSAIWAWTAAPVSAPTMGKSSSLSRSVQCGGIRGPS